MVTAFPVIGKRKSFDICQAFLQGCKDKSQDAAVFYGVNETNANIWKKVKSSGRPYWYLDNSYFDETRGTYFRVTKNAIQCRTESTSTGERLRAIFNGEPELKPWRDPSAPGHVVVCPQSDIFMELVSGYTGNWLKDTLLNCGTLMPNNPVVLRAWSANKIQLQQSLRQDLQQAILLVTHTSAAAVTAVMEGVPIHTNSQHALWGIGYKDDDRLPALRVLADNQWTLDEIREGKAWQWLNQ